MTASIGPFDRFDKRVAYMGWWRLDDAGHPVPCKSLDELNRGTVEARRVARDEVVPGCEVSTAFLGLDHSFSNDGPPIWWETFVRAKAALEEYRAKRAAQAKAYRDERFEEKAKIEIMAKRADLRTYQREKDGG